MLKASYGTDAYFCFVIFPDILHALAEFCINNLKQAEKVISLTCFFNNGTQTFSIKKALKQRIIEVLKLFLVRQTGLEPVRQRHTPLKRACLPIPALPQKY